MISNRVTYETSMHGPLYMRCALYKGGPGIRDLRLLHDVITHCAADNVLCTLHEPTIELNEVVIAPC